VTDVLAGIGNLRVLKREDDGPRNDAPPIGNPIESSANRFKLVRFGEAAFDPNEEWRISTLCR
jgi:hypothetical protein